MRAGELIIHLKGAKGIKGHEFMGLGRANMYAAFCIGGENRKSNVVRNGGSNPQWNEQVSFKIAEYVNFAMYDWLHISLYQPHDIKRNSPRGTVKINVEKLLEVHRNEVPSQSYPVAYKGKQRGMVELALSFIPSRREILLT